MTKQNKQELSDLVPNNDSFAQIVGNKIKKAGRFLYQTVRQSLDADIFLVGLIASYFVPGLKDMEDKSNLMLIRYALAVLAAR